MRSSNDEHREMVEAIAANDPARAEAAHLAHVVTAKERLMEALFTYQISSKDRGQSAWAFIGTVGGLRRDCFNCNPPFTDCRIGVSFKSTRLRMQQCPRGGYVHGLVDHAVFA